MGARTIPDAQKYRTSFNGSRLVTIATEGIPVWATTNRTTMKRQAFDQSQQRQPLD